MELVRADQLLIRQGFVNSRSQAADYIRRGMVTANNKPVQKPGTLISKNSTIAIENKSKFVSRGGDKLDPVMDVFGINVTDLIVLDCGASTGGFTDCLLQRGARCVYAVDTGYGQLHWKLRNDDRVIVMEKTNIRTMNVSLIPEKIDLVTIDVSFISLRLVLPVPFQLVQPHGAVIALIKPQFEIGRDLVGSGGVVRNTEHHRIVLKTIAEFVNSSGWHVHDVTVSPLKGPKGNTEFFFYLRYGPHDNILSVNQKIDSMTEKQTKENNDATAANHSEIPLSGNHRETSDRKPRDCS